MITDWGRLFPGLLHDGYALTSLPDNRYNCIAWAAGANDAWWEPDPLNMFYWPPGAPREYSIGAYIAAFRTLGYDVCRDPTLEDGFEKVAIYTRGVEALHAARQLPNGLWASKLGQGDDIHHTLMGLAGTRYGDPTEFLRRTRADAA